MSSFSAKLKHQPILPRHKDVPIGWPEYPKRVPSTINFTTTASRRWRKPRWKKVWFPDTFVGPMTELLCALEQNRQPTISSTDNLKTMALVEACYRSARKHRAVKISEITRSTPQ